MAFRSRSSATPLQQLAAKACRCCVLLGLLAAARAQQPQIYLQHFVPDLTGDSLPQADAALRQAGLTRGDLYGPQTAGAQVISQTFAAHSKVQPGAAIGMTLAVPQQKIAAVLIAVPALDGMNRQRAVAALSEAGLLAGDTKGPALGLVTAQQPVAGSQVVPQTAVDLTFALRLRPVPEFVTVPLLEGKTEPQAAAALLQAGLEEGSLAGPADSRVREQAPEAGDRVRRGTQVHLDMAADTMHWILFAVLAPLLAVAVWLGLKLIHAGRPVPAFALLAHPASGVYGVPRPQPPRINFSFSVRDHMPPPTFTTAAPPRVRHP